MARPTQWMVLERLVWLQGLQQFLSVCGTENK
jgi:hypothetical protein